MRFGGGEAGVAGDNVLNGLGRCGGRGNRGDVGCGWKRTYAKGQNGRDVPRSDMALRHVPAVHHEALDTGLATEGLPLSDRNKLLHECLG